VDFEHSQVDLGIRYGTGSYPGLASERLFVDEIFPVYSPRMLEGRAALKNPSDLRGQPLIHTDWTPDRGHWPGWTDWLRAAGVTGNRRDEGLRSSDGALVIQAAIGGQGVALGSKALVLEHLAAGRLIRPFKLSLLTDFGVLRGVRESARGRARPARNPHVADGGGSASPPYRVDAALGRAARTIQASAAAPGTRGRSTLHDG